MSDAAAVYLDLRAQALGITRGQLEGQKVTTGKVLVLLMETGYPEAVVTLVGVADGSTSLYFSNGGGTIGAGEHDDVVAATSCWLDLADGLLDQLPEASEEVEPPGEGVTQFVATTETGRRAARAAEEELGAGEHPLSALFYAGHDVITEIRRLDGE